MPAIGVRCDCGGDGAALDVGGRGGALLLAVCGMIIVDGGVAGGATAGGMGLVPTTGGCANLRTGTDGLGAGGGDSASSVSLSQSTECFGGLGLGAGSFRSATVLLLFHVICIGALLCKATTFGAVGCCEAAGGCKASIGTCGGTGLLDMPTGAEACALAIGRGGGKFVGKTELGFACKFCA